jgi:hypothetical protein
MGGRNTSIFLSRKRLGTTELIPRSIFREKHWIMGSTQEKNVWAACLALILAFAFTSRLYLAVSTPFIFDEYQWAALADSVDLRPNHFHLPLHGDQHPPAQVYWTALGTAIFGQNLLGYRAPSVIFGTIAVGLIYFLGKLLSGPKTGLLAAFLLATNEYHIGVSRLCTEKNYLTFALLGLLLFEIALRRPSVRGFVASGAAMGFGMLTKQSLVLWVPIFGLELLRRPETRFLWRRPGPWYGLLVLFIVVSPDLFWNVTALSSGDFSTLGPHGNLGLSYQLSRLSVGTWSWAPLGLYFPPLYFHFIESGISEYAVMTPVLGIILLVAGGASVYLLRSPLARLLQILGFGTLLFFCLFTSPAGEFWWADLTILPFIVLTGGVLAKLRGAWNAVTIAAIGLMLIYSSNLVRTRDNYFPLEWGTPPKAAIEAYRNSQRLLMVAFRDRDHLKLCSFGDIRLPACDFYADSLFLYQKRLITLESEGATTERRKQPLPRVSLPVMLRQNLDPMRFSADGWPAIEEWALLPDEKAWVQMELEKFRPLPSENGGSPQPRNAKDL